MAMTQLDEKTALIAIDLQYGIVALPEKLSAQLVIENTNRMISAFRERDLPVVLVNVSARPPGRTELKSSVAIPSGNWATLVDDLIRYDDQILITKQAWGAFNCSELHPQLRKLNITQIVVVGIATSMGVMSTAMQAYELGYNVSICDDAVADISESNHAYAMDCVFPKISEIGCTNDLLELIALK